MNLRGLANCACVVFLSCTASRTAEATGGDWPQWRHDAGRSAAAPEALPDSMHLLWSLKEPSPAPSHPYDVRLCYDLSYEPVALGNTLFVPSMVTDSVTALDNRTGLAKWKFYANGPVRFAPIAWKGRAYFVSDDGYLYCVEAKSGRLHWKLRGAAESWPEYKVLGQGRLVSRWPALGAPVLDRGRIFFAAGFWSNEGVYVCAVDAQTGKLLWRNSEGSFAKIGLNDHGGRWYGGLSPQGYLALIRGQLFVPCGRSLPAVFDPQTGKMDPYTSGWGGRYGLAKGSWWICGLGKYLFHSGDLFGASSEAARLSESKPKGPFSIENFARLTDLPSGKIQQWIEAKKLRTVTENGRILVRPFIKPKTTTYIAWWNARPAPAEQRAVEQRPRLQIASTNQKEVGVFREPILTPGAVYYSEPDGFIRSAQKAGYKRIVAIDTARAHWALAVTNFYGENPLLNWWTLRFEELWSLKTPLKAFIRAGPRLYCGEKGTVAAVDVPKPGASPRVSWSADIEGTPSSMLAASGKLFVVTREGAIYCFGQGPASPAPRPPNVAQNPPLQEELPPLFDTLLERVPVKNGRCLFLGLGDGQLANAILAKSALRIVALEKDPQKAGVARNAFSSMGMYGTRAQVLQGRIHLDTLPPYFATLIVVEASDVFDNLIRTSKIKTLLRCLRPYGGMACFRLPLEQAEALAKNIRAVAFPSAFVHREKDWLVLERKGPLPGAGDWSHTSGSPGNSFSSTDKAARPPLGMLWHGGSLAEILRTRPFRMLVIATGRMFLAMPDSLYALDLYTGQQIWKKPVKVDNMVATPDSLYATYKAALVQMNPGTGDVVQKLRVPPRPGKSGREFWRNAFRIWHDSLVGLTNARRLVCVDRATGRKKWDTKQEKDGLHFVLGQGRCYGVGYWRPVNARRGEPKPREATVFALDLETGRQLWRRAVPLPEDTVDPATLKQKSWLRPINPVLSYSEESDVLLLTAIRSTLNAFQGADGTPLWQRSIPCKEVPMSFSPTRAPTVLSDFLVAQSGALYDLRSGNLLPLRFWHGANSGTRGCGRALASRRILTVRDANASFFDLDTGFQTYLRGTRASCSFNLFPADGLLVSPYASFPCTCNYGVRTSFALAPMPELAPLRRAASPGEEKRLRLSAAPGESVSFRVSARNWSGATIKDTLRAQLPGGWVLEPARQPVEIRGNGAAQYQFTVRVPLQIKQKQATLILRATSPHLLLEPAMVQVFLIPSKALGRNQR